MPVRTKRTKDIITVAVEVTREDGTTAKETYRCKWLNERTCNLLYAALGEYNERTGVFEMATKNFTEYCYDLAVQIIIGWNDVTDEDGEIVPFNKREILNIDMETVIEIAQKYMSERMGVQFEREEDLKNSDSTSPSAVIIPNSEDAVDVPKLTEGTD